MKKIILSVIFLCLLIPSVVQAKSSQTALLINGSYITTGAPPIILNGTTYVPLRNLFENIDFAVIYSPQHKAASAWYNKGSFRVDFTIGSNDVGIHTTYIDETSAFLKISGKPILKNGSVYVPLRAFGELFGADVKYDKYINTVFFNSTVNGIKQKIFPLVGLSLTDPRDNPNSVTPAVVEKEETIPDKKVLTAKQIAALANRVGYVISYDSNQQAVAQGSGFLIKDFGLFVTNDHVADSGGGLKIYVNGEIYDTYGEYLFDNASLDVFGVMIAKKENKDEKGMIVKFDTFPYIDYRTDLPEIGDKIYAIGSPKGFENSLSEGIVSSIRNYDGYILIQHTADIDHGSSGGVLLNEYGEAIGITSSGVEGSQIEFAIPMKYVQQELDKINNSTAP